MIDIDNFLLEMVFGKRKYFWCNGHFFSLWVTVRGFAMAGLCISCPGQAWPQSASYALSGNCFTNYKFGLLCRPIKPDLVRAATPFFPRLFPHLPCDCTSMGAGASHAKVTVHGLSVWAGFVFILKSERLKIPRMFAAA